MSRQKEDIAVVVDSAQARQAVDAALSGYQSFREVSLRNYTDDGALDAALNIFCVNLGGQASDERLKGAIKNSSREKLFVLPEHNSDKIDRLGRHAEESCFLLPLDAEKFRAAVKSALNRQAEHSWQSVEPVKQKALKSAVQSFEKCFGQVAAGGPIPLDDIKNSCQDIREAAKLGGLDAWIQALDTHHNYSFRHSMFVCGSLTYFAQAIGIRGTDLEKLSVGSLIHDVGKSKIPVDILDKPGKLDDDEWIIMRKHPDYSREVMLREHDLDPDMISMAVQHHEKLDGTGYPEGLSNGQISDHVRLTAIADVYSALIDKRAYKGSMSSEAALDMMGSFTGHLDMDLLREFRSFTLDKG